MNSQQIFEHKNMLTQLSDLSARVEALAARLDALAGAPEVNARLERVEADIRVLNRFTRGAKA